MSAFTSPEYPLIPHTASQTFGRVSQDLTDPVSNRSCWGSPVDAFGYRARDRGTKTYAQYEVHSPFIGVDCRLVDNLAGAPVTRQALRSLTSEPRQDKGPL